MVKAAQISIWQVKPYKLVSDPVFASEDKFKNERFKISNFVNCMLIMVFFSGLVSVQADVLEFYLLG